MVANVANVRSFAEWKIDEASAHPDAIPVPVPKKNMRRMVRQAPQKENASQARENT